VSLGGGFGGGIGGGGMGDKGLNLPLLETLRMAWADPDLRQRLVFVIAIFGVFAFGTHVPAPVPGVTAEQIVARLKDLGPSMDLFNIFGGQALSRLSVFALGLTPYITASIIMQILAQAIPQWKQEMQEGGEYARKQQNRRTRALTLALCFFQGWGMMALLSPAIPAEVTIFMRLAVVLFWTAGSMFLLWLGEQISEKGIGNGVSLMIFAGIILSLPTEASRLTAGVQQGIVSLWSVGIVILIFLAATWFIVYFTTAQRRIPIQHMRRMVGTKRMGGQTSYLPLSVNMAGVLPIIFAVSLVTIPAQMAQMVSAWAPQVGENLHMVARYLQPGERGWAGLIGAVFYTGLIFFFTYFWIAIQYNVEDISNNLKRAGSFIPGVRPGKQTKDFLDGVISRVTVVGASFIAVVALLQYVAPRIAGIPQGQFISIIGGTSLLIMVTVALETMRQIEANLLMKQYGQ
jgi:preprotein translocase subunit SecY